jgi:ankyrin repeat protein
MYFEWMKILIRIIYVAMVALVSTALNFAVCAEDVAEDPLEVALKKNDVAGVILIVGAQREGIKWRDEYKNTFLHLTIDSPEIVNALIKLKPELDAQNAVGNRALHFAVKSGNVKSASALISAGAAVQSRVVANDGKAELGCDTILSCVAWVDDPLKIKELGKMICDKAPRQLNAKGGSGYTPLMHAADRGNIRFAKWLLENGADKSLKNDEKATALDCARGRIALIKENKEVPAQDDLAMIILLSK